MEPNRVFPLPASGPELTIAFAAGCRDELIDALGCTERDLALDLSRVTDFDSAGVQLLLAARRSVQQRGGTLQVERASPVVRDALAVFGLADLLGPTAAEPRP